VLVRFRYVGPHASAHRGHAVCIPALIDLQNKRTRLVNKLAAGVLSILVFINVAEVRVGAVMLTQRKDVVRNKSFFCFRWRQLRNSAVASGGIKGRSDIRNMPLQFRDQK
jgi:hypothetical protein